MAITSRLVATLDRLLPGNGKGALVVLIYHRVHEQPDPMFPGEADAVRFDAQMDLLARHCAPLPLPEAVERLREGRLPSRAVAVTFDDGYADNATVAAPILRRHGIPATFFVSTGFLDGGRMWNDTVIEALRRAGPGTLDLTHVGLGAEAVGADAERGRLAERVLRAIKHLPPSERAAKADELAKAVGVPLPDDLMMTRTQVQELALSGMEVGAHTVNHPILRLLSREEARAEIVGSRLALEGITGRRVRAFAYPNGRHGDDYTSRDRDLVEEIGFELAVSTQTGAATATSDRFELPRFTPWDRSPARWLARLLLEYRGAARQ